MPLLLVALRSSLFEAVQDAGQMAEPMRPVQTLQGATPLRTGDATSRLGGRCNDSLHGTHWYLPYLTTSHAV